MRKKKLKKKKLKISKIRSSRKEVSLIRTVPPSTTGTIQLKAREGSERNSAWTKARRKVRRRKWRISWKK